jgi:hypothetical protein
MPGDDMIINSIDLKE